ncbi:MAG: NAD(P)H-hydrate epimerase, partial [Mariprofundus sp.]
MSETCILTAAQMRWADQATINSGTSGFSLMDRAGRAVASAVLGQMPDYGRVVIITGAGNNGGDGCAAAHYLKKHRIPVTIVSLVPVAELSGDSKAHAERALEAGAKIREACSDECISELSRWLLRAVIVVDAIFGTGLNRPLQGQMLDVIQRINQADRPVL